MPSNAVSCTSSAQVGVGEGSDGPGGGGCSTLDFSSSCWKLWLMICACLCAPSLCVACVFSAGMSTCQEAQEVNTQTRLVGALRVLLYGMGGVWIMESVRGDLGPSEPCRVSSTAASVQACPEKLRDHGLPGASSRVFWVELEGECLEKHWRLSLEHIAARCPTVHE